MADESTITAAPFVELTSMKPVRSAPAADVTSQHSEDERKDTFCTDSEPARRRNPCLRQWIAAITVSMLYFAEAAGYSAILQYEDAEFPNKDDLSNIWGSIMVTMCVAGILSFAVHSILLQLLNRKLHVIIICMAFYGTGFAIMYLETYKSYKTRYVVSIFWAIGSTGSEMLVPVYISETTTDSTRGRLIAIKTFRYVIHSLAFLNQPLMAYSGIVIAMATVVALACFWLPETPVYLLKRRNAEATKKSLRCLHGYAADEEQEVGKLWTLLKATHSDTNNTIATIRKFSNIRTLGYSGLVIILRLLEFLSGFSFARVFLLIQIPSTVENPIVMIIIMMVIIIPGAITGLLVCDHIGHRKTLLISIVACAVSLLINGIWYWYVQYFWEQNIISLLLAAVHIWSYSFGISFLPTAITIDIFPPNLLNVILAISGIISWIFYTLEFISEKVYENNTVYAFLWPLSAVCAVSVFFFYAFLPETTHQPVGASLLDILEVETAVTNNERPKSIKCETFNSSVSDEP